MNLPIFASGAARDPFALAAILGICRKTIAITKPRKALAGGRGAACSGERRPRDCAAARACAKTLRPRSIRSLANRPEHAMAAYQYIYVMKGLSKVYPGGR